MNALAHIRRKVFRATQEEMADVARVSQATWSRWEHGVSAPSLRHLDNIRAEAMRRKLAWDDRWFFHGAGRTGGVNIARGLAEAANN